MIMSGLKNKLISDGTVQLLGTVSDSVLFSLTTVRAVNPTASVKEITIWVTTSPTPSDIDLVEAPTSLTPKGRYEQNNLQLSPGEKVFVYAPVGVVFRMETVDEA
jgi:hypothetical protein